MKHPSEEQLIAHYYGETGCGPAMAAHLDTCPDCRASYLSLRQTLALVEAAPDPDPGPDYENRLWSRLQPRLVHQKPSLFAALFHMLVEALPTGLPARLATAGALAVLLAAAFFLGRLSPRRGSGPSSPVSAHPPGTAGSERILLAELGEHLESSQTALIALLHLQTNSVVDLSTERELARRLVDVNRLYRVTAARLGENAMVSVLEDLERTLIEISDGPSSLSAPEFAALLSRVEDQDVLFKVRVVKAGLRARERATVRQAGGNSVNL
jgi:hypothetical protein